MKKYIAFTFLLSALLVTVQSCKKTTQEDTDLYNEIVSNTGYTYYVGTPGIKASSGNSPHGFERIRFNSIAQAALDSNGKLPAATSFPDGAIIVKDIYSSASGSINLYAVMKKAANNSAAGHGYLWAEFETDGKTVVSISKKGSSCTGCHSGSTNRDLVRVFDLL